MRKHIQKEHPQLWESFGFPSSSTLFVAAKDEGQTARATIRLFKFFFSRDRRNLQDSRLNSFVVQEAVCITLIIATMFAELIFLLRG